MNLPNIIRPTVLLDERICRKNIRRMAEKCRSLGIGFNPHFKTHQSYQIGEWFRDESVNRITVSSVQMATYFAQAGWNDITIAFPCNIREIDTINLLSNDIKLTLDILSPIAVRFLNQHLSSTTHFMIEIDAGYSRTGVLSDDYQTIDAILSEASKSDKLQFYGFYIHPGHTYDLKGKEAVQSVYDESLTALAQLRNHYSKDFPSLKCSVGDTPGCSMLTHFPGIDEIRPGNFAFYDLVQQHVGACDYADIAVVLAAPVVAKESSRKEITIHGGGIHLSKDSLTLADTTIYGRIGTLTPDGWSEPIPETYIRKLSQEHGIVVCSSDFFEKVNIGDLIAVYPVHSCLTVDCMRQYLTLTADTITMM